MELVNFLASLMGFFLVIVCLALLLKPKHMQHVLKAVESETALFWLGLVDVAFGLVVLLSYNAWDHSWKVLITILGWLALLKGAWYLFMPESAVKFLAKSKNQYMQWLPILLVVGVVLGCVLVYFGMSM